MRQAARYCKVNLAIWNYMAPVYLICGILLNTLAVIVWLRPLPRRHAGCMAKSIVLLACCDMLSLYSGFLRHYIRKNSFVHIDIQQAGVFSCKVTEFLVYFSLSFSAWLISLVTVERCLLITASANRRLRLLDASLSSNAALVVLGVVCALFNAHILWTRVLADEQQRLVCINTHEQNWQFFLSEVRTLKNGNRSRFGSSVIKTSVHQSGKVIRVYYSADRKRTRH